MKHLVYLNEVKCINVAIRKEALRLDGAFWGGTKLRDAGEQCALRPDLLR